MSLSCDPLVAGDPTRPPAGQGGPFDWRDLLYLNGDSVASYSAAGYWVTYLEGRYGWQRVAELWRRAPPALAPADFERAFAEVFPTSMDQAWFDALHAPDAAPCQLSEMCRGPAMVPGEPAAVECDGKFPRTLVVTDQPGVVLSVRETGLPLTLVNCANIKSPLFQVPSGVTVDGESHGATLWASLPPGTYAILSSLGNPTGEVTLESILPRPLLGSTCEEAGSVSLDPSGQTFIDLGEGWWTAGSTSRGVGAGISCWPTISPGATPLRWQGLRFSVMTAPRRRPAFRSPTISSLRWPFPITRWCASSTSTPAQRLGSGAGCSSCRSPPRMPDLETAKGAWRQSR